MARVARVLIFAVLLMLMCAPRAAPTQPTVLSLSPWVTDNLAWLYFWSSDQTEFAGCLYGEVRGDTVHVESMQVAVIEQASRYHVDYVCRLPGAVGTVHSHTPVDPDPVRRCTFSPKDTESRTSIWAEHPQLVVEILVCGPTRYAYLLRGGELRQDSMPGLTPSYPSNESQSRVRPGLP